MAIKDGFTYWYSYYDAIKDLPEDTRHELQDMIMFYMFEDRQPSGSTIAMAIFKAIKRTLDKSKANGKNGEVKGGFESNQNRNEIELESKQSSDSVTDSYPYSYTDSDSLSVTSAKSVMDLLNDDENKTLEKSIQAGELMSVIEKVDERFCGRFSELKHPLKYCITVAKDLGVYSNDTN